MEQDALVKPTPAVTFESTAALRRPYRHWIDRVEKLLGPLYIGANVAFVAFMLTYVALNLGSDGNMCDLGLTQIDGNIFYEAVDPANEESQSTAGEIAMALRVLFTLNPLQIRILWGPYSFPAVKAIDVFWNLLVGRAGQLVAGIFTVQTITAWLIQTMSSCPVPHDMLMEAVFSRGSSLSALWQFTRPKQEALIWKRHKLHLVTFALCITYVLSFPTLNSSASGYVARSEIFTQEPDGSLRRLNEREWNEAPEVTFVIENGHLIGQSDPVYFWTISDTDMNGFASRGKPPTVAVYNDTSLNDELKRLYDNCQESCNVFRSLHSGNFTFPANETLKIRFILSKNDYDPNDPVQIIGDVLYTAQEMFDMLVCVSEDKYFWGFSYHLLLLWSVLNLFHAIAIWVTWQRLKQNRGIRAHYGIRRAAVDFATMTRDVMGIDIHTTTEKELQKTLNDSKAGLIIPDPDDRVFSRAWSSSDDADK